MNLVKVAELLKNAPDQALVQELSHPTGSAPSYMILSELERRKKTRNAYKQEQGGPQSSVAEDAQQEVAARMAPAMGLGSMPQAQNFSETVPQQAPVGMAQGGSVPGFAGEDGSYVDPDVYTSEQGWNPFSGISKAFSNIDWTGKAGWSDAQDRKYKELLAQGYTPEQAKAAVFPDAYQAPKPVPAAAPQAAPQPQVAPQAPAAPRTAAPVGVASIPTAKSSKPSDYSVNPLLEEIKGYRTQMAEAYKDQAQRYKDQAEEIKKAKDSDIGFALMQAGLGIAGGRSANALENIAQGAQPAMQQYIGMDKARREQLQKLALGEGALGIEQLGAQMKGASAEGELGLGGEKMDIARMSAAADMLRANAAAAGVANQASQWKQDNAQEKVNQQKANSLINFLKTEGVNLDEATKAQYVAQINRLLGTAPAQQNKLTGNAKEGYKYGY